MSYETDLKIQKLLNVKQTPPRGYLESVDYLRTETNAKKCSEVERRLYGKPFSKSKRKKIYAKIEFFKRAHIVVAPKNSTPNNLEKQIDVVFQKYINREITTEELGAKIVELRSLEDSGGIDNFSETEELNEDLIFYENARGNNLITKQEYLDIVKIITARKMELTKCRNL